MNSVYFRLYNYISSEKFHDADDRRVLLAITVEINDGQIELLSVRDGDCLEDLATKFCKDHSISDDYVPPLTHHLASKLQSFG